MISAHERWLARRYLRPGRAERFIFLVGLVSLLAVALGVAALIAVMSVMNGFRAELFERMQGLNGHAVAQGYGGRIDDWRAVLALVRSTPGVVRATPLVEQPLMVSGRGRVEGALVRGMTLPDIRANPVVAANVKMGSLESLADDAPVVAIGLRLAEALGVTVGDTVALVAPAGEVTPMGVVPRIVSYRVGAVFEVGIYDFDKAFVLMPLAQAQTLLGLGEAVGMIEITTRDPDRVDRILAPLATRLAPVARLVDWRQMNSALFEALVIERTVMFWVLSIIILVAVFNILSSLIMLVRAKTRDIAILRTMGASRGSILRVFMGLGTFIGLLGVLLGLVLGFLVLAFRQPIVVGLSRLAGIELWDPSIRYLTELPARTDPIEVGAIVALALGLSFLATLYPAWKAASTDPVAVLRHD
ncbi:MAG: lipoprotein-releasing ABC transporter permease subunit [Sphingomonadaceae bacterium]|uniref:lipoprotein-releasing ABC transporter permease subunit n=1 Tax=Thermaurantiacus sp. TaxID=2820283 RepID=UPI00298F34E0|nr:lipoprotein-releasing ABC transporter permease subunit [Thermaurantiacus sp.]MCS6986534.1 lipoprotein-releasing ABC transporter permease subunit [Sphingomonadaceae bacterium]MDW8414205.1 lipoprotein-releasing ABC transporter permease subunit [Thermaurantiacus sp.]